MPAKRVPITGEVLAWAIRDAGLDEGGLAAEVDVPSATVHAWTTGAELPGTGDLRHVAKVLNRPTLFFLQSEPPSVNRTGSTFRRRSPSGGREPLRPEEDRALKSARRLQRVVSWLRERRDDKLQLPEYGPTKNPSLAASDFRRFLRWKSTEQQQAPTASRAFSLLRQRLEDFNLMVMLLPMRREGCRGFALIDAWGPLVAVNSAQTMEARIFTLMHECGHIVRAENSFDASYEADSARERWCERFAAGFLLPELQVRRFVIGTLGGQASNLTEARRVAARFRVSLTAACIRLEELSLAPAGLTGSIGFNDFLKPEAAVGFNPDPSTAGKRLRELGPAVVSELLQAEELGDLRRHDVQRYLHVSDESYVDLANRVREAVTGNLGVLDENE